MQLAPTTLDGMIWWFCLSFGMSSDISLTGAEIGATGTGVAWARRNLEPWGPHASALVRFGPGKPLKLPMQSADADWGLFTYWRTAPTSCNGTGWSLLGELDKLISVSRQRFTGELCSRPPVDAD